MENHRFEVKDGNDGEVEMYMQVDTSETVAQLVVEFNGINTNSLKTLK